jgi:hypothetical protein
MHSAVGKFLNTRRMLRNAARFHGKLNKKFRELFFQFLLAIEIPHPIWGLPAKICGV